MDKSATRATPAAVAGVVDDPMQGRRKNHAAVAEDTKYLVGEPSSACDLAADISAKPIAILLALDQSETNVDVMDTKLTPAFQQESAEQASTNNALLSARLHKHATNRSDESLEGAMLPKQWKQFGGRPSTELSCVLAAAPVGHVSKERKVEPLSSGTIPNVSEERALHVETSAVEWRQKQMQTPSSKQNDSRNNFSVPESDVGGNLASSSECEREKDTPVSLTGQTLETVPADECGIIRGGQQNAFTEDAEPPLHDGDRSEYRERSAVNRAKHGDSYAPMQNCVRNINGRSLPAACHGDAGSAAAMCETYNHTGRVSKTPSSVGSYNQDWLSVEESPALGRDDRSEQKQSTGSSYNEDFEDGTDETVPLAGIQGEKSGMGRAELHVQLGRDAFAVEADFDKLCQKEQKHNERGEQAPRAESERNSYDDDFEFGAEDERVLSDVCVEHSGRGDKDGHQMSEKSSTDSMHREDDLTMKEKGSDSGKNVLEQDPSRSSQCSGFDIHDSDSDRLESGDLSKFTGGRGKTSLQSKDSGGSSYGEDFEADVDAMERDSDADCKNVGPSEMVGQKQNISQPFSSESSYRDDFQGTDEEVSNDVKEAPGQNSEQKSYCDDFSSDDSDKPQRLTELKKAHGMSEPETSSPLHAVGNSGEANKVHIDVVNAENKRHGEDESHRARDVTKAVTSNNASRGHWQEDGEGHRVDGTEIRDKEFAALAIDSIHEHVGKQDEATGDRDSSFNSFCDEVHDAGPSEDMDTKMFPDPTSTSNGSGSDASVEEGAGRDNVPSRENIMPATSDPSKADLAEVEHVDSSQSGWYSCQESNREQEDYDYVHGDDNTSNSITPRPQEPSVHTSRSLAGVSSAVGDKQEAGEKEKAEEQQRQEQKEENGDKGDHVKVEGSFVPREGEAEEQEEVVFEDKASQDKEPTAHAGGSLAGFSSAVGEDEDEENGFEEEGDKDVERERDGENEDNHEKVEGSVTAHEGGEEERQEVVFKDETYQDKEPIARASGSLSGLSSAVGEDEDEDEQNVFEQKRDKELERKRDKGNEDNHEKASVEGFSVDREEGEDHRDEAPSEDEENQNEEQSAYANGSLAGLSSEVEQEGEEEEGGQDEGEEKEKEKEEEEEEEQRRREEEEKKERRREQEKKREEERQKQNEERRKVDERRREEAKEERRKKAEEEERRRSNERRRDAERRREMDRREIDRRRDDERRREDDNRRRARSRDRSRDALRRRTRSRDRSREDAIRRRTRSRDRSREDAIRRRTRNQDKSREDTVRRRTRSRDRSREERRRQDDEVLRKHNNDGAKDQPERVKAQDAKRKEKDEDRGQKEQDGRTEKEQDTDREQQKEEADGKGKEDKNVEESKTKKELEAMRQQQATLSVLRVLQKLSNANPDNFQTLKGELDDVLEKELPQTGSQRDALRAEADRVIDYAKQYVEQIREQQRKLEEMRGEQQKKSVEDQEATAKAMLEELKELVSAAEIASETVHDAVGPLAGENDLEDDHVLKIASEVEATGKTALGACSACADFILTKRPLIEESLKTKGDSPKAASIKAEFLDAIAKSNPRIQVSTRQATEALQTAKASRERITRKMASARWNERLANLFREYDRDGDSLLNRAEVAAYAKGEFAFEMPEDNLNRISRQLFKPPAEGVEMQNFQLLKSAVGIARDEVKQLARRAQRLEKERVDREAVKERGASLQTKASKQTAQLTELENTVKLIELDVEVISKEALELTGQAVKVKSDALEEKAQGVNTAIASVLQEAQVGCNEAAEAQAQVDCKQAAEAQDVVSALPSTFKMINSRAHTLMLQLRRGTNKLITVRKHALEAEFTKFETLRLEVVTKLRIAFEAQGGKVDAIFDSVSTDGERVTKADLRTFVAKQECGIDVAKLDAVFFAPWSALGDGTTGDTPTEKKEAALVDGIGRQDFVRLCRLHYRVVKEIVVSDDLRIEKSKQLRRMEVGEIMEVLIGPAMDPSVGVYRVNGKAFKDGISGWVTVAGNGGITFLAPGGNVFKVRKRVGLSEELKDVSVEKCVRHLVEGEVLDLVDWARTSRSALGVTRVQVKARADGAIGWATITDSDGATFLEAR
eukprot:TRINITY_DN5753_c0_g1_i7.p1 TRINITY_DN5753_c0_g1~~TRINITY_DN5753_c0_g1_i7.p1  ORF type:complete len:2094 (-),score=521.54 TRINITY_DN5753_c0_g1_i7:385-6642(-)